MTNNWNCVAIYTICEIHIAYLQATRTRNYTWHMTLLSEITRRANKHVLDNFVLMLWVGKWVLLSCSTIIQMNVNFTFHLANIELFYKRISNFDHCLTYLTVRQCYLAKHPSQAKRTTTSSLKVFDSDELGGKELLGMRKWNWKLWCTQMKAGCLNICTILRQRRSYNRPLPLKVYTARAAFQSTIVRFTVITVAINLAHNITYL